MSYRNDTPVSLAETSQTQALNYAGNLEAATVSITTNSGLVPSVGVRASTGGSVAFPDEFETLTSGGDQYVYYFQVFDPSIPAGTSVPILISFSATANQGGSTNLGYLFTEAYFRIYLPSGQSLFNVTSSNPSYDSANITDGAHTVPGTVPANSLQQITLWVGAEG
jgi:hypothetical protein